MTTSLEHKEHKDGSSEKRREVKDSKKTKDLYSDIML